MFVPGITPIPASGAVLGIEEKDAMIEQINKGWLTAGNANKEFEKQLAEKWGFSCAKTCNSGSSANLLAVGAMVESGAWKAGDEIITVATSFPTTINPLLQYGLVPVFTDIDIGTYNATYEGVKEALSEKTRGIMLAHTLGHPFPQSIRGIALIHNLRMISDCCDAFCAQYVMQSGNLPVGKYSDFATCSFFPAHHITTGEGGAVFTDDNYLATLAESLCSWGRDCYCDPGIENSCGKRFEHEWSGMPYGYDHKYTYTRMGYNLKMTEVQAVCGIEQLKKVDAFIQKRNENWSYLNKRLEHLQDHLILPQQRSSVKPSWFGFVMTIKEPGQRTALQEYLATYKIGSRLLFGGNITRQPYMQGRNYRISGSLENSDKVMEDSLWVGVWPGLTEEMLDFVAQKIEGFFA